MIGIPSGWEDAAAQAWSNEGIMLPTMVKLECLLFGRGYRSTSRDWRVTE